MAVIGRLAVNVVADISGLKRGLADAEKQVNRSMRRMQTAQPGGRGRAGPGGGPAARPSVGQALGGQPGYYSVRPQPVGPGGLRGMMGGALGKFIAGGGLFLALQQANQALQRFTGFLQESARTGLENIRAWERAADVMGGVNQALATQEEYLRQAQMELGRFTAGIKAMWTSIQAGFLDRLADYMTRMGRMLGVTERRVYQLQYRHVQMPFPLAGAEGPAFRLVREAQLAELKRMQTLQRVQMAEDFPSPETRAMRDAALGRPVDRAVIRSILDTGQMPEGGQNARELGGYIADGIINRLFQMTPAGKLLQWGGRAMDHFF